MFLCSVSALVILASMVEISDRPFGGVSNRQKVSWTADKFRDTLLELADPGTRGRLAMENLTLGNHQQEADEQKDDQQPEIVDFDPQRGSYSDDGRISCTEMGIPRSDKGRGK